MMYEVKIANVKRNEVNDALNCAVNRLFEKNTAIVSATFRNDVVAKIVGADFEAYDNFSNKGIVVGYVLTKQDFSHINGASFTFNKDVPICILGKDIQITESKMGNIDIVQMDMDFTYQSATIGNTAAMDSPLWDAYMATYFAVRKQTNSYVARTSGGMRWSAVAASAKALETIKNAYIAIGKMYGSRYTIQIAGTLKSVDDVIFDHRLFWEEENDED